MSTVTSDMVSGVATDMVSGVATDMVSGLDSDPWDSVSGVASDSVSTVDSDLVSGVDSVTLDMAETRSLTLVTLVPDGDDSFSSCRDVSRGNHSGCNIINSDHTLS